METLGTGAMRAVARATEGDSRVTHLHKLALPARKEPDGLPVKFDREVDLEIPQRLICWRPDHGPFELRREMRSDERAVVEARFAALELALRPYNDQQVGEINASIGAMLAGFRSMRQQGDDVESTIAITRAVLREFPAWAILQGCLKIARRETRCDPRFAPNDAEISDVIRSIIKPYQEARAAATALLGAVIQQGALPQRGSGRETHREPPLAAGDGKHGQRVLADIAARKARIQTDA